jgi:CARDB
MKTVVCLSLFVICALLITQSAPMPDLIVRGNAFEFVGDKSVNVYVSNNGDAPSKRYVLELAVRKIGNAHVARVTTAIIPGLRPGKFAKISVDATNILPNTVNLKDTTNLNAQPNENNNEKWHNLP